LPTQHEPSISESIYWPQLDIGVVKGPEIEMQDGWENTGLAGSIRDQHDALAV
jgi:hypothetical protein